MLEMQNKNKNKVRSLQKNEMLYKRAFIYIHCFGLYEYSCPYSFETLYLLNLKGQCFRGEKPMQGKWDNDSSKNKCCLGPCVVSIGINQHPVGQVGTVGFSTKRPPSSKGFCFLAFIPKEENLKRENACSWAGKMNYFSICVGSVGLWTLELSNILPWFSTPAHQRDSHPVPFVLSYISTNLTVFWAGLFHNNSILEHQSYFIVLLLLLFFNRSKGSKPHYYHHHLLYQQISHIYTGHHGLPRT